MNHPPTHPHAHTHMHTRAHTHTHTRTHKHTHITRTRTHTGEIHHYDEDGVVLQDGSHLDVDLVIYCTGYSKTYDFLEPGGWGGAGGGGAGCV